MLLFDREIMPSACEACADKRDTRACDWATLCPFEFRLRTESRGNTDLARMDAESPNWRKVLSWQFGHRGLLVRGESGHCKTRAMWRLIRRLFDERRKVIPLTAAQFDRQCRDAGGSFTLSEWFNRLATADVLFLDDLGKGSWTQGTEAQIFDLIDERTREGRPILATSNDTGATLAARLSQDRGEPLVRRLRDYCDTMVL
jgi:DNA replication protein DnaC